MFSIFHPDAAEDDVRKSNGRQSQNSDKRNHSSLSMDDAFLNSNLHFHDFHNASRTCECGKSILDYWNDDDRSVCPVVCDSLCDLLPVLAD